MEQMKIARYLKLFSIITAFIGGLFFFWYLPLAVISIIDMYPEASNLKEAAIICIYFIAILCYIALYNFGKSALKLNLEIASVMKMQKP